MNEDKELEESIKKLKKDITKPLACGDTAVVGINDVETVLQALENSIPKRKIKNKIEELKNCKMDIVQSPVHNVNEKMKMLNRNMIKREVLQELLEDK